MKAMRKLLCVTAITMMLALGSAAQAMVVSSGFETGDGLFDFGSISLDPGTYSMGLSAFTFETAGPFIFGLSDGAESYQVSVGTFGSSSLSFTTLGGLFDFFVGGNAGLGAIYQATVTPVPLSPAFILLGSALIPMVRFGRREPAQALPA